LGGQGPDNPLTLAPARWFQVGPAGKMARAMMAYLAEKAVGEAAAVTKSAIEEAVTGNAQAKRSLLDALLKAGYVKAVTVKGHDKFYVESDADVMLEPPDGDNLPGI